MDGRTDPEQKWVTGELKAQAVLKITQCKLRVKTIWSYVTSLHPLILENHCPTTVNHYPVTSIVLAWIASLAHFVEHLPGRMFFRGQCQGLEYS